MTSAVEFMRIRTCVVCAQPSGDLPECIRCAVADETVAKRRGDL